MAIEWNEAKRLANLEKHGLDFVAIDRLFDGRPTLHIPSGHPMEARSLTIGLVDGVFVALIWTW